MKYILRKKVGTAEVRPMKEMAIALAVGVVALASCVKEGSAGPEPRGGHAYIVEPETRTDFDSHVGKFSWSNGDRIAIHLSDGTFYETPVDAETGIFTCSTTATKRRDAYAVYPASVRDDGNYGTPTLKVVLPAEYNISAALASDYSPVPMVAVNRQEEDDLFFHHVGGLLRITCDRVPAGTQKIALTLDRNVAGSFTVVNPQSDNPVISEGGDSPTVTFRVAETALSQRTDGVVMNLPVPVGTYSSLTIEAFDAAGTKIYSVIRDIHVNIARSRGKKFQFPPVEESFDSMQMVVTAGSSTAWTFTLPFLSDAVLPANLSIEWGDGTVTNAPVGATVSAYASSFSHTYASAGDYTITLDAAGKVSDGPFIPNLRFYQADDATLFQSSRSMLKSLPTPLLKMEGDGLMLFRACSHLATVCADLFSKNSQFTTLERVFQTSGLTSIPSGLFDHSPAVKSFFGAFAQCASLTAAFPADLLALCPEAEDLSFLFAECSNLTGPIPSGIFDHNAKATTFANLFQGCGRLGGSIPAGLFDHNPAVTSFRSTFNGCGSLTGGIPEGLFDHCPEVVNFSYTFSSCTGLTGIIPPGLFDHCPKVTEFQNTFSVCSSMTGCIPPGLFDKNTEVTTFYGTFSNCHNLTGPIPAGLFDHCPKVTSFAWTFNQCQKISGSIPEGLFDNNLEVVDFNVTFSNCYKLTGEIPHGLFRKHLKAVWFGNTFGYYFGNQRAELIVVDDVFIGDGMTKENRFASCTEPVYLYQCFSKLKNGTAPDLWNYTFGNGYDPQQCFVYCNTFTNYDLIPAEWR